MTPLIHSPSFFPFQGTFNDVFDDVCKHIKQTTPINERKIFWETQATEKSQNITQDLLFEALALAFFQKHPPHILNIGNGYDDSYGFFDFAISGMEDIYFQFVGRQGIYLCGGSSDGSLKYIFPTDLKNNKDIQNCLSPEQLKDTEDFLTALDVLAVSRSDTLAPVIKYIQQNNFRLPPPMKEKYPDFYPLFEKRVLAASINAPKSPPKPKKHM